MKNSKDFWLNLDSCKGVWTEQALRLVYCEEWEKASRRYTRVVAFDEYTKLVNELRRAKAILEGMGYGRVHTELRDKEVTHEVS